MGDRGPDQTRPRRRGLVLGGAVIALGLVPVLLALDILPSEQSSFRAPRWVVAAAGAGFVLAGLAVIVQGLGEGRGPAARAGSPALGALQHAIGLAVLGCLAAVFNWVAFGPGERHCAGGLSLGFLGGSGQASETACRAVFSLGAMLGNVLLGWATWHRVKRHLGRRREIRR